VVDHSSYTNAFRDPNGPDDNYVASFMAGCIDPNTEMGSRLTISEKSSVVETQTTIQQEAVQTPELAPDSFMVYFPNDSIDVIKLLELGYENGLMNGSPTPTDKINYYVYESGYGINSFVGGITSKTPWNDNHNYGLNGWWEGSIVLDNIQYSGFSDPAYGPALAEYLNTKCKFCVINIQSFASVQGKADYNQKLADGRTASVKDYLLNNLGIFKGKDKTYIDKRFPTLTNIPSTQSSAGCSTAKNAPTDTYDCKKDRSSRVSFSFSNELAALETIKPAPIIKTQKQNVKTKITNRLYDESKYFERLKETDNFVFDRFREKIKYFHPAFHSTTPEGLNSRLTFLHQCTRQGGTLENKDANNLSFGRPPICILRLGDFYNTKIVIDNINIDYEPLVWDLNPEGIGVQPMIANVTMSFKFIGGSTMMGPINKLQNALSFNYYANTHVYDPRADYLEKSDAKSSKLGDYMLVKGERNLQGFNQPNNLITSTTSSMDAFDVDQVMVDALANSDEQDIIEETPITKPTLISVKYNKDNSTKSNGYWYLNVILGVKDATSDSNSDAASLITDGYVLSISSIKNPAELYQILLTDKSEMVNFINQGYTSTTFLVPINGENGNTKGMTDYFGKSTFTLSLSKNDAATGINGININQINIKLK
jgi:hypothetical protein